GSGSGCTLVRWSGRWPGGFASSAETSDERGGDGTDIERYEQLRQHALGGDTSGWRLGLAVLQRHGVAAWTRASQTITAPAPARAPVALPVDGDGVVGVLAAMALACLRAG
ncbi:MAG: hypothetical protein ACRD0V_20055, partial [Acidimicrobiales bacterium]